MPTVARSIAIVAKSAMKAMKAVKAMKAMKAMAAKTPMKSVAKLQSKVKGKGEAKEKFIDWVHNQEGIDAEDHGVKEKPAAVVPRTDDHANWKQRKYYFDRSEAAGEFDEAMSKMVAEANSIKGGGKRARIRKIVEEAVQKRDDGKWELCIKRPFFEEYRTQYRQQYGDDKNIIETYTYAKKAAGGKEELEDAIASGEVEKITDQSGVAWYKRRQLVTGTKIGTDVRKSVGGKTEITKELASEAAKQLEELEFNFNFTSKEMVAINDTGDLPVATLARMDGILKASDQQHAYGKTALQVFEDPRMQSVVSSEQHKAELDSSLEKLVDAVGPVRRAHMMGKVKMSGSEKSQGVTAEQNIKVFIATLLAAMKECHKSIIMASTLVKNCTSTNA